MENIFFEELRRCIEETASETTSEAASEKASEAISETASEATSETAPESVPEVSITAHRYFETAKNIMNIGALSLEKGIIILFPEAGDIYNSIIKGDPLEYECELVSYGVNYRLLSEILIPRFLSLQLHGTEGVLELMRIAAAFSYVALDNMLILRKKLDAMVPRQYFEEYRRLMEKEFNNTKG